MKVLGRITLALVLVALTALPVMAQATVVHDSGVIEGYSFSGIFICLDEDPGYDTGISTGTLRWHSQTTLNSAGGYNLHYHENISFTGVGDNTGNRIAGHWSWNEHINGRVGEVQHLVWAATVRNMDTHDVNVGDFRVHVTVKANGTVTVDRADWEVHCPGY